MGELTGILLINLGTPDDPSTSSVRKYLKQFLSDPRVIELPMLLRWLLLRLIILPFRTKKSAHAYASIWNDKGSPLLTHSLALKCSLQNALGAEYYVALGMRYGQPSIEKAISELDAAKITQLIILPLFPQYSSAANGSAIEQTLKIIAKSKVIKPLQIISDFHTNPFYIDALVQSIKPYLAQEFDFLLFSYHGLPERQLINPGVNCYKTKCLQTSDLLINQLNVSQDKCAVSFQSRLGKLPWIKPYTDQMLIDLRDKGIRKLLVACPSFVVDCLETLEEINIRAKQQWLDLGGESLQLIPCLNEQPIWIEALCGIVRLSYSKIQMATSN